METRLYYKLYYLYIGHIIPTLRNCLGHCSQVPSTTTWVLHLFHLLGARVYRSAVYILLQLHRFIPQRLEAHRQESNHSFFLMMARLLRSSFFRANMAITIVIISAIDPPCDKPINRQKGKRQSLAVMEIRPLQSSKKEPFVCFDLSHKLSQELMTTLSFPWAQGTSESRRWSRSTQLSARPLQHW